MPLGFFNRNNQSYNTALALIKKQMVIQNDYRCLGFLNESYVTSILDNVSILQAIPESEIILAPGRSPFFHALALKSFRTNVFSFAYSGHPYAFDKPHHFPTQSQLIAMRTYLSGLGLTPGCLFDSTAIHIVDYIDTGASIESLTYFFSHWQHDILSNKITDAYTWYKEQDSSLYSCLFKKLKLYPIGYARQSYYSFPHLSAIPTIALPFTHPQGLYYNCAFVPLPFFPMECWEVTTPLEEIDKDYYAKAIEQSEMFLIELSKHTLGLSTTHYEQANTRIRTEVIISYYG